MESSPMDTSEYQRRADDCLAKVASWLEDFDPDEVDYEEADGVLKLVFPDGKVYVLNRQAGSHQMWLAAEARAWHYNWSAEGEAWLDDRDAHNLFANLAKVLSTKIGREVAIG